MDAEKLNKFKISYLMFFYYISMISSSFSKIANLQIFQLHSSYIILKIRGIGKKTIAYYQFYDEVFINGIKQDTVQTQYYLNDTDNEITLFINRELSKCKNLFFECRDINEIDLSNFNSSSATSMKQMFYECFSVTSLNLNNLDTANVKDMSFMFYGLSSLSSLNVSNLDTSQVTNMLAMFYKCSSIVFFNLTNFNTSKVETMAAMFAWCDNLKSIDLSSFDTSNVNDMRGMFNSCPSIIYLDLSSFNTSQVTDMYGLFYDCRSLTSIDLSSFDTSNVINMCGMFNSCPSIISLDLSGFNTSKVTDMSLMFYGCSSLNILNLSNFDTSRVYNMFSMFRNCILINTLDLYNFNTRNVIDMSHMFSNCTSLSILNLSSFNTPQLTTIRGMFCLCLNLTSLDISNLDTKLVSDMAFLFGVCESLTSIDLSSFDTQKTEDMQATFYDCISLKSINLTNFDTSNVKNMEYMFLGCSNLTSLDLSNFNTSNVETMHLMFGECSSLISLNLSNFNTSKVTDFDEMFCDCTNLEFINFQNLEINPGKVSMIDIISGTVMNMGICTYDATFISQYDDGCIIFDCSDNLDDKRKRIIAENNTCVDNCSIVYNTFEYNFRCYKNCPYGYIKYIYFDSDNHIQINCSNSTKGNEAIINSFSYETIINSHIEDVNISNNIISKNELIINVQNIFNISIDKKKISDNIYIEIPYNKTLVIFSSTNYLKNNDTNKIIIDLGMCENILKEAYNILYNETLYILILSIEQEGMKIDKIEYEVFNIINKENLIKLNLTLCKNRKLKISYPVSIDDDIDKFNSSSDYYNNVCYKTTSEFGTDICLKDRRNIFIDKNMTLCEENCILIDYDFYNERAKCSCIIKISLPLIKNIKIDKERLKDNFININNIANLQFMKCYKDAFNKNIIFNYGFYILDTIICLFWICLILFYSKFYYLLLKEIKTMFSSLQHYRSLKNININNKNIIDINNSNITNFGKEKNKIKKNDDIIKLKVNRRSRQINNNQMKKETTIEKSNSINDLSHFNSYTYKKNEFEDINKIIDNRNNNNIDFTDTELNSLSYKEALTNDKRTFIQYYISLLKMKHLVIFSFYPNKDYNSRIIKIFLFFFFFAVHFTLNALFYNDTLMHQIYADKGSFDFIYQIPQIIYSSLISSLISAILKNLSLSHDKVIKMKEEINKEKNKKVFNISMEKFFSSIKIGFGMFFIITYIILSIFWYYITCFCGIYKNTQVHLIKDSIFCFITSFIYQFFIYLLPSIFRIIALKGKNKKHKLLYKFSKLLGYI